MKIIHWKDLDIKDRMFVITIFPLALMFSFIIVISYYSRLTEVNGDLKERAQLIALALGESSQYGVVSGNIGYVERTIHGLIQRDKGISRILILNARREILLDIKSPGPLSGKSYRFEQPIHKELIGIDTFDDSGEPHLSGAKESDERVQSDIVGYVLAEMTPSIILAKQRHRILIGSSIFSVVLLLSVLVGYLLAKGATKPLAEAISALRKIRRGNYQAKIVVNATGEMGELQKIVGEISESLEQFEKNMTDKVIARTIAVERARDMAIKSNDENRKLIQKINTIVEEERSNIAMELHDQLNATLIVVGLEARRLVEMSKKMKDDDEAAKTKDLATSIVKGTSDLYALGRDLVRRLHPEVIDTLGIRNAVEDMVNHFNKVHAECRFEFRGQGDFSGLGGNTPITVYRIIQEALSNVVKHSKADVCRVQLNCFPDRKILQIEVSDNGMGIHPGSSGMGVGLIGMRERVFGAGGKIYMSSEKVSGMVIFVELPIDIPLPEAIS